jgi:hypothetical protein
LELLTLIRRRNSLAVERSSVFLEKISGGKEKLKLGSEGKPKAKHKNQLNKCNEMLFPLTINPASSF